MPLKLTEAEAIFALLPTEQRAMMSMAAIRTPADMAVFIGIACEIAADTGLGCEPSGEVKVGLAWTPTQSRDHFAAAAKADPALAKAADRALKTALTRDQRLLAMVRGIYAVGLAVDVRVVPDA